MISKSKLGASKLGATAFVVAIGLASPALAQMHAGAIGKVADPGGLSVIPVAHYGASNYAPSQTGGGSSGYNYNAATDYRLKQHRMNGRARNHPQ